MTSRLRIYTFSYFTVVISWITPYCYYPIPLGVLDYLVYVIYTNIGTLSSGNRLLFVDLIHGGVGQLCTGDLTLPHNRTDGSSESCEINSPQGIAVRGQGSLFLTEHSSKSIRAVNYSLPADGEGYFLDMYIS